MLPERDADPRREKQVTEKNHVWAAIVPKPEPLWKSALEMAEAYRRAEPRIVRSQRYSLTLIEPLPETVRRRP